MSCEVCADGDRELRCDRDADPIHRRQGAVGAAGPASAAAHGRAGLQALSQGQAARHMVLFRIS